MMSKKHLQILQESQTRASNLALFLSNYATQANVGTLSVEEILRHQQQVNDGGNDPSLLEEVKVLTEMQWVDLKEEEEKRRRRRRAEKGKEAEHEDEDEFEVPNIVSIFDMLSASETELFPVRLLRLSETLGEHVRRILSVSLVREVSSSEKDIAVDELAETLVWDLRSLAVTAVFASAKLDCNVAGQTVQEKLLVQAMYLVLTVLRYLQAVEAFVVDERVGKNSGTQNSKENDGQEATKSFKIMQASKLLRRLSLSRKRVGENYAVDNREPKEVLDADGIRAEIADHGHEHTTDHLHEGEEGTLRAISTEVVNSIRTFLDCVRSATDVYTTNALTKAEEMTTLTSETEKVHDSDPKSHSMMELCPRRPSSASRGFLHHNRHLGSVRKSSFSLPRPNHPSLSNTRGSWPIHRTASYSSVPASPVWNSSSLPDVAWNDSTTNVDPSVPSNVTPRSVSGPPGSITHSAKQMLKKFLPTMPWKKAISSFAPKSSERGNQPASDLLTQMSEQCHFTDINAMADVLNKTLGQETGQKADNKTLQETVMDKGKECLSKVAEDAKGGKKNGIFQNLQKQLLKSTGVALGQDTIPALVTKNIGGDKTDEVKTNAPDSNVTLAGNVTISEPEMQAISDILSIAYRLSQSLEIGSSNPHTGNQTPQEQEIERTLDLALSQVGDLVLRNAGDDDSRPETQIKKKLETIINAALDKAGIPHVHPVADRFHRMGKALTTLNSRGTSVSSRGGFKEDDEDSEEEERLAPPLRRRSSMAPTNRRWASADDVDRSSEHAYRSALKSPTREWASEGEVCSGTLDGTLSNGESSRRPIKRQVSFKGLPDDEYAEDDSFEGESNATIVGDEAEKKTASIAQRMFSANPHGSNVPSAPFGNSRGSLFGDDSDARTHENLSGSNGSVYQHEDGGSNDSLDLHGVPISEKGEQDGISKRRISLPPAYEALKRRISALRRISRSDQGTGAPGINDSDRNAYLEKLGLASSMASQAGSSEDIEGGTVEMGTNRMPMPDPRSFGLRMPEPTISQAIPQQMPQPQHQPYEFYNGQVPVPMTLPAEEFYNMAQNQFGFYPSNGINLPSPQITTFQTTIPDGSYATGEAFPQIRFIPIPITIPVSDNFPGYPSTAPMQLNLAQYYTDAVNSEWEAGRNMQQQESFPNSNEHSMGDFWAGNTTSQIEPVFPSHVPIQEVVPIQQWMVNCASHIGPADHTEHPVPSTLLPEPAMTQQPTAQAADKLTKVMFKRGWDVPSCVVPTQSSREGFMSHMLHRILGGGVNAVEDRSDEERYMEGRIELDDKGYLNVYPVFQRRSVPLTKLSSSLYLKHGVIDSKRRVRKIKSVWHHTESKGPPFPTASTRTKAANQAQDAILQLRLMNGTHIILKFETGEEADEWRCTLRKVIDRVTETSSRGRGDKRRRRAKGKSASANSHKKATVGQ